MGKPLGRLRFWIAAAAVLVVLASLCGPEVRPALASPASTSRAWMHAGFMSPEPKQVCLWKKLPMEAYLSLIDNGYGDLLAPLLPEKGGATLTLSASLGSVTPQKFTIGDLWANKIEIRNFTYTARKAGHEVITVKATWAGGEPGTATMEFDVKPCNYKVHGIVDLTKVTGMNIANPYWQAMGTYDVSGTVVAKEDSIKGEGTVNLFMDETFTGQDIDGTCTHNPPWQGASTVEMDGDIGALAENGTLDLKFTLEPLAVNATTVTCQGSDGGGGSASSPAFTVPSFDLDFDPLPADGGATARNFSFPHGKGTFEIDLTVSPEAAS
jgi:hypothetical protein